MKTRKIKPSKKLKIGELYKVYDFTCQIEIDYGICVFTENSFYKHKYNKKGQHQTSPILKFYSFNRNEMFDIFTKDFNSYGISMYVFKDMNDVSLFNKKG